MILEVNFKKLFFLFILLNISCDFEPNYTFLKGSTFGTYYQVKFFEVDKNNSTIEKEIDSIFRAATNEQYDMNELLTCIVDEESYNEYKADYGRSMVCGYARIGGWPCGIVANQRCLTEKKTYFLYTSECRLEHTRILQCLHPTMFGTSTGMRLCLMLLEVAKSENRFKEKVQREKIKKNVDYFFVFFSRNYEF